MKNIQNNGKDCIMISNKIGKLYELRNRFYLKNKLGGGFMKRGLRLVITFFILFSTVIQAPHVAEGAKSTPKIRVLEIYDNINNYPSKLKDFLGTSNYEYTSMPMKKFVALREELDGKYDMIAIMEGTYSHTKVTDKNHNTTSIQNDITSLKLQEIINSFINKGKPVILNSNTIYSHKGILGQLESFLNKPNVFTYTRFILWHDFPREEINSFLGNTNSTGPRFSLTTKPSETTAYQDGDNLGFNFTVQKPVNIESRDLKARLSIDSDFNDQYSTDEIVKEIPVTSQNSVITFQLPKGYSGVRYWKLELIDNGTGFKDYEKGMIKFVDQTVELKVLQVTPNTNYNSSLLKPGNMNQSYLEKTNEYKINIDVTNMEKFNASTGTNSHTQINGKYDMVIFGFGDEYNNTNLNENSSTSLETFISSEQSVMFTHDTIFEKEGRGSNSNNRWLNNFKAISGQIDPKTNLGYNAPYPSTSTANVNSGIMTSYPYNMEKERSQKKPYAKDIALTHNQYFTLNLEDMSVIPWYNIKSDQAPNKDSSNIRDENDSWNHYYTYSKGNITYSGTGHTNTGFPDWEQKLFINTMYRAFLGSNHAPMITVISPNENDLIPSNQNIELAYNIQDFDLRDKKIATKVYVNNKLVFEQKNVSNGTTIVQPIPHGLPEGGNAAIRIEAIDAKGAKATKELNVKVVKLKTNLQVNRTVQASNPIKVNENTEITYTITPQDITGELAKAISGTTVTLNDVTLTEKLPADMEVSGSGKTSGTLTSGLIYTQTLNNIVYKKVGTIFRAEPVTFTVNVKPTEKQEYILKDSTLRYKNALKKDENVQFNQLTLVAENGLEKVNFPATFELSKDVDKNFSLDLDLVPSNAGIKSIEWSEGSNGDIISINPETGAAKVLKDGKTKVKVKVTDVFGKVMEKEADVTVRKYVNSISVEDMDVQVGETKGLSIKTDPAENRDSLTLTLSDPTIASIDKENFTITGLKQGDTILTVIGITKDGELIRKTAAIKVTSVPVGWIEITPNPLSINKFDKYQLTYDVGPDNATNKKLIWKSLNPDIVRVDENGKVEGVGTGKGMVLVSSEDGNASTEVTVNVGQPLKGISVLEEVEIEKGETLSIINYYDPVPKDATNITSRIYKSADDYYVSINADGEFTGNRIGQTVVKITLIDDLGIHYTADLKVNVIAPGSGENGNGNSKY